jgi:hypothetical protein
VCGYKKIITVLQVNEYHSQKTTNMHNTLQKQYDVAVIIKILIPASKIFVKSAKKIRLLLKN